MAALNARSHSLPEIRLAELLGALSHALDMVEGQPAGHCVRCCWIGTQIGAEMGLEPKQIWELYYTLLLKDLGCSSNAARICQLYMIDDIAFKRDFHAINGSLPQVLRFVLSHTGMQAGLAERFRALVHIFQNGGQIAQELMETRCDRGAEIARKMRFSEAVAQAIRCFDEHWDGHGRPAGLSGEQIPIYARISLLAQIIDVFQTANGVEAAKREILHRTGTWFDPGRWRRSRALLPFPDFGKGCAQTTCSRRFSRSNRRRNARWSMRTTLTTSLLPLRKSLTSNSPFTSGHSERVTLFSDLIAKEMGMTADQRRWLKRAALLHDIGKLGVSNSILDKPGKLDPQEWASMQMHAAHTETILSRISAFSDLAPIAAAHHERLYGKGYPKGLRGDEIALETRIITTADIFDALTAERPYRSAMPVDHALAVMTDMVGVALDPDCFNALRRAIGNVEISVAA